MGNSEVNDNAKTILVVDDILYVVKSIANILSEEGYNVITAMSGIEALDQFRKYSPSLITIDQKLPDMSGLKLIGEIKKFHNDTKPKIIIISAVYDREEINSLLQQDVDNYLLKPFKRSKLIEVVNKLLGKES